MAIDTENGDDEVGYCKPPKKSQWKKGTSGNPGGRKRESNSRITHMIASILDEKVPATLQGKKKRITTFEALFRAQVQRAFKSDQGFKELMKLVDRFFPQLAPDHVCGGVIVVPAQMPVDEWEKWAGERQAKYRGNTGDRSPDEDL